MLGEDVLGQRPVFIIFMVIVHIRVHRHATKERNAKCRCDLFSSNLLVLFGFTDLAVKAFVQKWFQFTFHIVDWLNS